MAISVPATYTYVLLRVTMRRRYRKHPGAVPVSSASSDSGQTKHMPHMPSDRGREKKLHFKVAHTLCFVPVKVETDSDKATIYGIDWRCV